MNAHRRTFVLAATGVALALGLGTVIVLKNADESDARGLPGAVAQSGHAESDEVAISIRGATFSQDAVDVTLTLDLKDETLKEAGFRAATLAGQAMRSAHMSDDGTATIRFPAPPDDAGDPLILVLEDAIGFPDHGPSVHVAGRWELAIDLPAAEDRQEAGEMHALQPGSLAIGDVTIPVFAYRTPNATVVRYSVPFGLVESGVSAVSASSGQRQLKLLESMPAFNGDRELRFEASDAQEDLSLTFGGLVGANDATANNIVQLTLGDLPPGAADADPEDSTDVHVAWQSTRDGGPELVDVIWHKGLFGTVLLVRVKGIYHPGISGRAQVTADGAALTVDGLTVYDANAVRGPESMVQAELPDGQLPHSVTVDFGGATAEIPDATVVLHPED